MTKAEEIKKKFEDVDYKLKDNTDGTRTIIFGHGAEITFRCLTFKEYSLIKSTADTVAIAKDKQLEQSVVKGFELVNQLGWQEGEALWFELISFKLKLDFHTKPNK